MKPSFLLYLAALAFVGAFFVLTAPYAPAQQPGACGPASEIMTGLAGPKYGERPVVIGATATGAKMVLTGNPETGTWTILLVSPDGNIACMMVNGDGLTTADAPVTPPGDPS